MKELRYGKVGWVKKLNEVVAYIRERGEVPFGQVCFDLGIAPPTLYNYWRMIQVEYRDIMYKDGKFISLVRTNA